MIELLKKKFAVVLATARNISDRIFKMLKI